jgi:hypothetical protein
MDVIVSHLNTHILVDEYAPSLEEFWNKMERQTGANIWHSQSNLPTQCQAWLAYMYITNYRPYDPSLAHS